MTKEEAYNKMQEGYPVSHKNFSEDEFLWMDENYIIKDEQGNDFENAWDVQNDPDWNIGWYIFKKKNKVIKVKGIPFRKAEESYIEEKQYISHIQGTKCAGKENCLQYSIIGEAACLMCDCNDLKIGDTLKEYDRLLLDSSINQDNEKIREYINNDNINNKKVILNNNKHGIINKIKNIFRRKH